VAGAAGSHSPATGGVGAMPASNFSPYSPAEQSAPSSNLSGDFVSPAAGGYKPTTPSPYRFRGFSMPATAPAAGRSSTRTAPTASTDQQDELTTPTSNPFSRFGTPATVPVNYRTNPAATHDNNYNDEQTKSGYESDCSRYNMDELNEIVDGMVEKKVDQKVKPLSGRMDTLEKSVADLKKDVDSFRNQVVIFEDELHPVNEDFKNLEKKVKRVVKELKKIDTTNYYFTVQGDLAFQWIKDLKNKLNVHQQVGFALKRYISGVENTMQDRMAALEDNVEGLEVKSDVIFDEMEKQASDIKQLLELSDETVLADEVDRVLGDDMSLEGEGTSRNDQHFLSLIQSI